MRSLNLPPAPRSMQHLSPVRNNSCGLLQDANEES
jgi:hypothetical protein